MKNVLVDMLKAQGFTAAQSMEFTCEHTLLSKKLVNNRRLTYVRFSYNCHTRTRVLFLFSCMLWKMFDHLIKHISKSES